MRKKGQHKWKMIEVENGLWEKCLFRVHEIKETINKIYNVGGYDHISVVSRFVKIL